MLEFIWLLLSSVSIAALLSAMLLAYGLANWFREEDQRRERYNRAGYALFIFSIPALLASVIMALILFYRI